MVFTQLNPKIYLRYGDNPCRQTWLSAGLGIIQPHGPELNGVGNFNQQIRHQHLLVKLQFPKTGPETGLWSSRA